MSNSNRGLASADEETRQRVSSAGGKASGGQNLENVDRSEAGKKGARAQSMEAKRKGGENSHRGAQ